MKVRPIYDKLGYDSWYGKGIAGVPSEPDGRFKLVGRGAVLIVDGEAEPPYVGTRVEVEDVPYYDAAQLPYQPNDTLLNQHLPPDPDRPNVRSTGSYTLRLLQERK